ncbi:acyltransferase [Paenibacillus sp. JCM 10914]|uniref:acyltransferase n=1 Tax=Paenibacillus sp. JCM 10914 TaxID=1236974 RepID=UPI0003CCABAC|nr:acyltransferase [Paenibacillus sp. JCM 10914]GAE04916.1 integral membrane protein [Paenibacillus sp. JCM 10914]
MSRERILEVEQLRGLAFLAVVLQHSVAHYSVEPGMTSGDGIWMAVVLMLTKFAVPVFIFLTGLVLFYNDHDGFQYSKFIKKRFGDIYVPFAIWTFITILINRGFHPFMWGDWYQLGQVLITGKASSHFWYIIMLFQFYLLYPLFRSVILAVRNKWSTRTQWFAVVAAGALYVVLTGLIHDISRWMEHMPLTLPVISDLLTTYADRNALYYYFYFVLGAAAGLYHREWKNGLHKARLLIWGTFAVLFIWRLVEVIQEIQSKSGEGITFYSLNLLQPGMALFLISSILAMYDMAVWICRKAGARTKAVLSSIGLYSYGAYLMHLLTLRFSYVVDEAWLTAAHPLIRIVASWLISVIAAYAVQD